MSQASSDAGLPSTDGTAEFLAVRPRLFGIAYRILGSASEAEDVLQEAWLRWQGTNRSTVREPSAFLSTATTRLALNVAQSARATRETYIGPWLPEPVDTGQDPLLGAERGEALELAVLLLLERLNPVERAAYVLREAFDYPYPQIAEILQLSDANARQLVSRARKHLAEERRTPVAPAQQRRLLEAFLTAAVEGDLAALEDLLASDAVLLSDGGGVVSAARRAILGPQNVAAFVVGVVEKFWDGADPVVVEANGLTGVVLGGRGGNPVFATLDAGEDGISRILFVLNPAKLGSGIVPGSR